MDEASRRVLVWHGVIWGEVYKLLRSSTGRMSRVDADELYVAGQLGVWDGLKSVDRGLQVRSGFAFFSGKARQAMLRWLEREGVIRLRSRAFRDGRDVAVGRVPIVRRSVGGVPDRRAGREFERVEARMFFDELAGQVAGPSRDVLQLVFREGLDSAQTAERLGLSSSHVCRLAAGIVEKSRCA